jgi:colanic acid biosynthesis glycosyl transferase WcaI
MRLALFSLNYAPEEIGIGRYSTDMAQELVRRGHRVEVVAGKPYYPNWDIPAEFHGGLWRKAHEHGVAITRCAHYVPSRPTGLRRVLHLVSFAACALWPAVKFALRGKAQRPEVVMCVAPALICVPVAWLAARLSGAKLWIHIQDFEVEAAFATGLVEAAGSMARLALRFENRALRLADIASSISPQMCAKLAEKGVAPDHIIEIRNWADSTVAPDPEGAEAYRREWGLGARKVALYSGNIANKQGLDIVIAAARLLQDRADIGFVICGNGPNRAHLESLAAGLTNIQFHDLQPSGRMAALLSLASVHLLPQIPGAADMVLPSKLTNMLASGRPVVATAEAGTGLYDEVAGCGINTPPGDEKALAQAIAQLVDDPPLAETMGALGRERSVERWSLAKIVDRLDKRLSGLRPGA